MIASRRARWLRRQWSFLASGRLTVWLLGILVFVLAAYLFLPQQGEVSARHLERWVEQRGLVGQLCRAVGLTDVLHSPFIWAPCGLMFVNLLLCLVRRRATLALWRLPERPPLPGASWLRRPLAAGDVSEAQIAELLRREGYRTRVADGCVYGLRGRFAILGHWLFHGALLVLLIVGTVVAVTPPAFRGSLGLGEGEPFDLQRTPLLGSNKPLAPELPDLRFRLDEVDVVTAGLEARRLDAHLTAPDGERGTIAINRPYRRAPYQVMVHGFGYMAGWVIADARGRMVNGAWVKLIPFPLERSDTFALGMNGGSVHVRLYPDHELAGEKDRTRSNELRNPRFRARVVWEGETVFNGLLAPDQRVELPEGLWFFFLPEIRKYALLEVIEEQAYPAVFACLGAMILGIAIRYVRIRREILVRRADGGLEVFGQGEIFESLFAEEFDRLTDALAAAAARPGVPPEGGRGVT